MRHLGRLRGDSRRTARLHVQTGAMTDVCRYIRKWINSLRKEACVAITVDALLEQLNTYLEVVGYGDLKKVAESDLKECLKRSKTVEMIKDGKEVLWLWGGRRRRELFDVIIQKAVKDGEVYVV